MPVTLLSCVLHGLSATLVEVEVDILSGMPHFTIVGLGDAAIQESKERIISAVRNSGFHYPRIKKTVNLAPADLKKHGPSFDLPIAAGLLMASGQIPAPPYLQKSIIIGELALDGSLKRINGALLMSDFAKKNGFERIFLPEANGLEASLIDDIEILPLRNLSELAMHFSEEHCITPLERRPLQSNISPQNTGTRHFNNDENDMRHIKGNEFTKRALEIAAAGSHNVLMVGSPGSGKTLLARAFSSTLPHLTLKESLEVSKVYSVIGRLNATLPLIREPPFRSVHHSASASSIIGGGSSPRPGEISLAHKGVLFLDEIAEFPQYVLETLRQPLEDHCITIGRASGSATFPAHFTLIGAMNPCPCGYLGDGERHCICSSSQILNYRKKLSGPLLDRIDLFVMVPRTKIDSLTASSDAESSKAIRTRTQHARDIQTQRFQDAPISSNSEMPLSFLKQFCELDPTSLLLIKEAMKNLHLSNRGYTRVLKISRTIADLAGAQKISQQHIAEALQYRPREFIG